MEKNLKSETFKGIIWSGIERYSSQLILFIVNIILARLLLPEDFGLIAIISVIIQICQAFIDGGFTNALIRFRDRNEQDYCTVYFFNIAVAVSLYGIVYCLAPVVADFYQLPQLTDLIRVLCVTLVINSLYAIHRTKLTIQVHFKGQAIIVFIATLIAGGIAVLVAYNEWGVWSLVVLTVVRDTIQSVLFISIYRWKPTSFFSKTSFRKLFGYSSKLLASSLLHLLYVNIYPIVIGKRFDSINLGYYNRADLFSSFPANNLSGVISRVSFPILSKIQDDNERLCTVYRKYVIFSSILIFPVMALVIGLAEPIVSIVLTEKWLPIVCLLRILSVDTMIGHIGSINLNLLYVKGRSDIAFKLEIIKKTIATSILLITMWISLEAICWGRVIYGIISFILNTRYTKDIIGLSVMTQVKDIFPYYLVSLGIILMCMCVTMLELDPLLNILISIVVASLVFSTFVLFKMSITPRKLWSNIQQVIHG